MGFDFSDIEGWSREITLSDGTKLLLRAEGSSDLESMWEMFSSLSEETLKNLPDRHTRELIESWVAALSYDRILPILAFEMESPSRMVASATLHFSIKEEKRHKAEYGVVVHDDFQGRGLGTLLTDLMIEIGRRKGLKKISLIVYAHNEQALHLYKKCGFEIEGFIKMYQWHYLLQDYVDAYRMSILL